MPSTPGRPPGPTIHHSRTRPEATDFALKNRLTNDWFRHDDTTMKVAPIVGDSRRPQSIGEWLASNSDSAPAGPKRCLSRQAQAVYDKVHGDQETWFKHDDNRHYIDPVRANRGSDAARQVRTKTDEASRQTMNWFKHDSQTADGHSVATAARLVGHTALEIGHKLQTKAGVPEWYEHNSEASHVDYQPKMRLTMKEAVENYERDRAGCTSDWCNTGDDCIESAEGVRPSAFFRITSPQGQHNAAKLSNESEHWFEHNGQVENRESTKKQSDMVKQISAKHRGAGMRQILAGIDMDLDTKVQLNPARERMTPEARQFACRSQQGVISRVFDEENNRDYQSSGGYPRAVKTEALATFNKNKGCMDECLQGYLAPPDRYEVHKSQPADKSILMKHSGVAMEKTLKGELPNSSRTNFARAVKPEATSYAERNRGTVGQLLTDYGRPTSVCKQGSKGLRTEAANEVAYKYKHGSVGQLLC